MNPSRRIHKDLVNGSHQDLLYDKKPSLTLNQSGNEMKNVELAARCVGEIKKIRLGKTGSEKYSLELLHRATMQGDNEAQEFVKQCFSDLVLSWLHVHAQGGAVCELDREEHFITRTFDRFWQSTASKQHVEFNSLADTFRFLKACLNGVLLDSKRAYLRPQAIPVQSEDLHIRGNIESNDIWDAFKREIPNGNEQRLAYLLFHCGFKPREIVRFCSKEYSDLHDIYQLRSSLLNRVVRNAGLYY